MAGLNFWKAFSTKNQGYEIEIIFLGQIKIDYSGFATRFVLFKQGNMGDRVKFMKESDL